MSGAPGHPPRPSVAGGRSGCPASASIRRFSTAGYVPDRQRLSWGAELGVEESVQAGDHVVEPVTSVPAGSAWSSVTTASRLGTLGTRG